MFQSYLRLLKISSCFLLMLILTQCTAGKKLGRQDSRLQLIGNYRLPDSIQFKGTTVGGLSGIDYDPQTGLYYLICDDRSSINPARFYTAAIRFNSKGIDTVSFQSVTYLRQPDGSTYPDSKTDPV